MSKSMAVEIEVLPKKNYYINLRIRYLVEDRQVLNLKSSIATNQISHSLVWLNKAVKSKRKTLTEAFSGMLSYEHVMVIEQTRLIEQDFKDCVEEYGAEEYPYPFLYDIDVIVNPDPAGNVNTGIGMRFSGLSYSQLYKFLN